MREYGPRFYWKRHKLGGMPLGETQVVAAQHVKHDEGDEFVVIFEQILISHSSITLSGYGGCYVLEELPSGVR